jgi:hypothetical protein
MHGGRPGAAVLPAVTVTVRAARRRPAGGPNLPRPAAKYYSAVHPSVSRGHGHGGMRSRGLPPVSDSPGLYSPLARGPGGPEYAGAARAAAARAVGPGGGRGRMLPAQLPPSPRPPRRRPARAGRVSHAASLSVSESPIPSRRCVRVAVPGAAIRLSQAARGGPGERPGRRAARGAGPGPQGPRGSRSGFTGRSAGLDPGGEQRDRKERGEERGREGGERERVCRAGESVRV